MKFDCEVIQDLLPLYIDNVCSAKSKEAVDVHVAECQSCKAQLDALGNQSVIQELSGESNRVIATHRKKEKKRSTVVGLFTAAFLMIPTIVCLICNIAVGHALDWFFIVLTSLMVFASVTVVPLLVNNNKLPWTLGAFTISLVALLGTICIYSGGNWFYIAVVPTVAGLLICFMPYVIRHISLPESIRNHKALITIAVDSIAVYGIIAAAGIYSKVSGFFSVAVPITTYCLVLPWAILLIMRYVPISIMFRASFASLVSGLLLGFVNDVVALSLGEFERISLATADFANWNAYSNNGNVGWCLIIMGVALSVVFAIIGFVKKAQE